MLVVFIFLFFFLHAHEPIHIGLCCQQLPHFLTGAAVLGIVFFLFLQQLSIFSLQFPNFGQLLDTHIIKGIFCRLMEQDFFLVFLAKFLGVTSLPIGHIGLAGLGIVDNMGSQDGDLRHTIEYIKGKNCGRMLLSTIKEEVDQVIQTTNGYRAGDRRKVIDSNTKNVVRHAYYHEYRSLQQLCILILRNERHQYGNGTRNVYGILFDGAWLWEEYVNTLIGDVFYHPRNKTGDGAQRLFAGGFGLIYPDFIGKENNERIIADAKYKPVNNISGKDYLQVLAYMFRFDAKSGYYLYPETGLSDDLSLALNKGMTYENNVFPRNDISVIKCGLHIPEDVQNYTDFVERIKENETIFRQKVLQN